MSIICENIITSGLKVKETILHVFNWKNGGKNVDKISLVFDNDEHIVYETELKLDLPNGDYHYINGEYILIEGTDAVEEIETGMFPDFKKLDQAIGYVDYLIESSDGISISLQLEAKKLKKELDNINCDIDFIIKKAGNLAKELSKEINNIPENIKSAKHYMSYLDTKYSEVVNDIYPKIKQESYDDFIKAAENFADGLETLFAFSKKY
jgi:hypothetical protein